METVKAKKVTIDGIKYDVVTKEKHAIVINGSNYSGDIVIPSKIRHNNVTHSVTSIGDYAFFGCKGLTSITIPNRVTSIGYDAFNGCTELKNVTIGNSVTSIGLGAFSGCRGLTSVTIPNSVTSIGKSAFYGCSGLTSIVIGNSVTSIGDGAFNGCSGLTSIEIPNSVTSIGSGAFYGTAWYNNQPDGIVYAGNVLYEYKGTMPKNTSIVIKEGTLSIGEFAFSGCDGLTNIIIPNSVTSIGEWAFSGCSGLTSITIPNSVTSIEWGAFRYCSGLINVTIGTGVKNIGSEAFAKCSNLTDVYCLATSVPSTRSFAFDNSYPEYMTLHVPAEAINSYKTTAPWSSFGNIVEITDTGIIEIPAKAVLVTSNNGTINITCSLEGESVELYTSDAMFIESTTIENGCATIESGLSKGDIAIVKIGEKSIKVIVD